MIKYKAYMTRDDSYATNIAGQLREYTYEHSDLDVVKHQVMNERAQAGENFQVRIVRVIEEDVS